jgi:hypothetical protein
MRWAFSALLFGLLAAPAVKLLLRSRQRAERQVSAFLLLLGAGLALRIGSIEGETIAHVPNAVGHVALSLAGIPLVLFTRGVFRPSEPWARWLSWAGIAGTLATLPLLALDGGFANEQAASLLAVNAFRALACVWSCAEAIRYRRLMSRRAALGLADAVLVDRFRLWSIWMGALTVSFTFVLAIRIAGALTGFGPEFFPSVLPIIRAVMATSLAVALVAPTLTFAPPRAYLRWLQRA